MALPASTEQLSTCRCSCRLITSSWQGWGVGTILIGLLSFMTSDELTTGGMRAPEEQRQALAAASYAFNAREKLCCELFGGDREGIDQLFEETEAKVGESRSSSRILKR